MLHSPIPPDPGERGLKNIEERREVVPVHQPLPQNVVQMLQLWILLCFQYIAYCLNQFGNYKSQKSIQEPLSSLVHEPVHQTKLEEEAESIEFTPQTTFEFPLTRPVSLIVEESELLPDSSRVLLSSVSQTSYITTIFEANRFGLHKVLSDVRDELQLWFEENGLLAIGCEMVWSVPSELRDRAVECRLKDELMKTLRHNNRRVLDLKWNDPTLPFTFPDATTQENSGNDGKQSTYEGVYRRFYGDLLPYQHKDTVRMHSPYWLLKQQELRPNPAQFLLGANRNVKELQHTTLVALNLIALKVGK